MKRLKILAFLAILSLAFCAIIRAEEDYSSPDFDYSYSPLISAQTDLYNNYGPIANDYNASGNNYFLATNDYTSEVDSYPAAFDTCSMPDYSLDDPAGAGAGGYADYYREQGGYGQDYYGSAWDYGSEAAIPDYGIDFYIPGTDIAGDYAQAAAMPAAEFALADIDGLDYQLVTAAQETVGFDPASLSETSPVFEMDPLARASVEQYLPEQYSMFTGEEDSFQTQAQAIRYIDMLESRGEMTVPQLDLALYANIDPNLALAALAGETPLFRDSGMIWGHTAD